MKIKTINKKGNKIILHIKDASVPMMNALRRTIINEVPTMAIENVEIKKNSSALYDEVLAHRLGLIPFKTDLKSYNLPENCKCNGEGCAKCSVEFTLTSGTNGDVLTKEIKVKDPKIKPVEEEIPIVKLIKEQKIEISGTLTLGKGKEHSKWSPGIAFYTHVPLLKTKDKEIINKINKSGVYEVKSEKIIVKDLGNKTIKNAQFDVYQEGITPNKTEFIMTIETFGQLPNKTIITKALDILEEKAKEFQKLL